MQESSEVAEAVRRFYERLSAGDVDGTSDTIVDDAGAFVIGTQRIGDGRESWMDSIRENASMGVGFEAGEIRGFADGDAGFAVDEPSLVLPNGMRFTARVTSVLRRGPDGRFRLVHQHYSWAVPDETAMEHAAGWREELGLATAA